MRASLKILGIISAVIPVVTLIIFNTDTAHVELFFVDGQVAVFLIIAGSFVSGFFTCLIFLWLRKALGGNKKSKRSIEKEKEIELFREI